MTIITNWRDFYTAARRGNLFGIRGPFYGPQGHRGLDFAAAPHEPIPSFVEAKCVYNGHSSVLGNYTVLRRGLVFYGWAHLLIGTRPDVGATVSIGESIGKAATLGDDHGSAWSGAHCHTTRGLTLLHIVSGRVLDPWPTIKKATLRK